MRFEFKYGSHSIQETEIPDRQFLALVEPADYPPTDDAHMVRWALQQPVNAPVFMDFAKKTPEILFVVNDATRPTPTASILNILFEMRPDLIDRVHFLIAAGVHQPPTRPDLQVIFGHWLPVFKERIHEHQADNETAVVYVGKTRRGTEVRFNALAINCRAIVTISSVEPHYFAGCTGGRKSFLPGIAGRTAIEQNHRLALDDRARILALRGNPVHEDMSESIKFLPQQQIYSIQTVLERNHRIFACAAGDLRGSFFRAVKYCRRVYCRSIPQPADIVITIVQPPMDVDLYQSHKAIENARPALKKGGILILVSPCRRGIGERRFYDRLAEVKKPADLLARQNEIYQLGDHKAFKLADLMTRAEVWAVTDLPAPVLEKIFIRPFPDLQSAVLTALRIKGTKARVIVLTDGGVTVPIVGDQDLEVSD